MGGKVSRKIEHPDDLIRGNVYSAISGDGKRVCGKFDKLEVAHLGNPPGRRVLYIRLKGRSELILINWRTSSNWREM